MPKLGLLGRMARRSRRKPKGDGRGSRFKRAFGVPEDKTQENFTDPESRIMKMQEGLHVLTRPT